MINDKKNICTNSLNESFDIIEELGVGGNGKVYKVKRKIDGKEFALKCLYNKTKEKRSRFIDEINITIENYKIIDGIIPIIDYSKDELCYTMPVADTVLKHTKDSRKNIEDIIKGCIQLADTLSKLHSKGISHRDIKPSNIYFYNDRYCFGDFGLVEFPDNPNDFTKSDRGLGAIFTIAPEMKRDPKNADGKKADVFSLAKTIWMLLTRDELGFDGMYNFLDRSHSLRLMDRFKDIHLVELEELLTISTKNDPSLRPNIDIFKERLEEWLDIFNDFGKSQVSEWLFLSRYLFGDIIPESTSWRSVDSIVNVLNLIGTLPAYNHMLFSGNGGLDFRKAELANESGCIYIYDTLGFCFVVKPKCLHYEGFNSNHTWNYFLFELDELKPIISSNTLEYEYLVEDYPSNYVSANYQQYGVYDYDSGQPLPQGSKVVRRYMKGKFLIVLKNGPYNHIPATYDGRHGLCDHVQFRGYIDKLVKTTNKHKCLGHDEEAILHSKYFSKNPFSNIEDLEIAKIKNNYELYKNPKVFIKDNYEEWCFKNLFSEISYKGLIKFYITFEIDKGSVFSFLDDKLYLCNDGYIKKLKKDNLNEAYLIYNREEALLLQEKCINMIDNKCIENDFDPPKYDKYFTIDLKKHENPTHLFTKTELKELMLKADDRETNMLVIDERGYVYVIQDTHNGHLYPVRHESWNPGNVYVGKYSKLITLDEDYLMCLQGWLAYLRRGESIYMDYVYENKDVDELKSEIKKYY